MPTNTSQLDFQALAHQVMQRCEELSRLSQSPDYLDRRYLSEEHTAANQLVSNWMQQAGMQTWQDAAGNIWGRYQSTNPQAKTLLMGSHLDTVPNGGKYDGMLGVIAPISLIGALHEAGITLPFHLDVVGFGDEEGTRFGSTLLGSRALTGQWPAEWATLPDKDDITLAQAMANFGLDFQKIPNATLQPETLLGYLEVHIEQGPVLEQADLPVGVVSAIAGAKRFQIHLSGMAGHAGTVPMSLRQDSLCAASEMILAIERLAKQHDVVATVGRVENSPNGVNVIAGTTQFSLDIRSADDQTRDTALADILQDLHHIAEARNITLTMEQTHSASAVQCEPALQKLLTESIEKSGYQPLTLLSGAGHDAMAIADICPIAMLFVRCDKGISHHPAEAIQQDDVATALAVLEQTLLTYQES
ncbi:allantoate amidohydrolase [Marinomonas agarivorans]|nr:allantoate amidohydrolase [Marinomonas agarivorans]